MRLIPLIGSIFCIAATVTFSSIAWSHDYVHDHVQAKDTKAYNQAMSAWLKHDYENSYKMLRKLVKEHPYSEWAEEADLHSAIYLMHTKRHKDAKQILKKLLKESKHSETRTKAKLQLADIAENENNLDEAIKLYGESLGMSPTWSQFKRANYRGRKLMLYNDKKQARMNCGPVALAACLENMGKASEATRAREITVDSNGVSLAGLQSYCQEYGVDAKAVAMSIDQLQGSNLPVLAHVDDDHFIAITGLANGSVRVEDSLYGNHELSMEELAMRWTGKVLCFQSATELAVLPLMESLETVGGWCNSSDPIDRTREDPCLGEPCDCDQDDNSSDDCTTGNCGKSKGRPTWKLNKVNLNLIVTDTPLWYTPGKGPDVNFTLRYSNENANTGIFGHGWRCPFDMRVYFLPHSSGNPTLQIHRSSGRIETYDWNSYDSAYKPRNGEENYGYTDTVERLADGTVVLSLLGGGKYYFMPQGGPAEGRIHKIEDANGDCVTCGYDTYGRLSTVTDASGGVTQIVTEGFEVDERVTHIRIPRWDGTQWVQWSADDPESRQAVMNYTNGCLTSITDMLGDTSTLEYKAMLFYIAQVSASSALAEAITTTFPANGGVIVLNSTDEFFSSGEISISDGNGNTEIIAYTGKTGDALTGITRGSTPISAASNSTVTQVAPSTNLTADMLVGSSSISVGDTASFPDSGWIAVDCGGTYETIYYSSKTATAFSGLIRGNPAQSAVSGASVYLCSQTPYLSEIRTPAKNTKFAYEWLRYDSDNPYFVGLHEIYECGPTESYSVTPTIHYVWSGGSYTTSETVYPASVHGTDGHVVGGLTRTYYFNDYVEGYLYFYDIMKRITDEEGNVILEYDYDNFRNRISAKDSNGNYTYYIYDDRNSATSDDGSKHLFYFRKDGENNEWAYTYYPNSSLHTEVDPFGRTVKTYNYNDAGQITSVVTPLGTSVENYYDADGRLSYTVDGNGKTTSYSYNDPRGFVTSITDPENNTLNIEYDMHGRQSKVTDPSGNVTRYFYDDLDRVTKTIFGANDTDPYTETKYSCCHKLYDQDENGRRTYYAYDAKARPFKVIASAKSTELVSQISYDYNSDIAVPANGGSITLASVADMPDAGKIVVFDEIISYTGRDVANNLLTGITRGVDGTMFANAVTGDSVGRVDTVLQTTGYHPDYHHWMTTLTDANGNTTYYDYYKNSKLKSIRYPDNTGEMYYYANNNSGTNLIKKEYGTFSGTYPTQTFAVNADFTVNYQYDGNNRLIKTWH